MSSYQEPPQKPNVKHFHNLLKQRSINLSVIYQALNIDPQSMEADGASLSMHKYLQLLEQAALQSGNPHLGADLGLESSDSNLGLLSYLLSNAPDFEKVIELLKRYIILVSPGSEASLKTEGDHCILTYRIQGTSPELCRQDIEGTIAQYVVMIRVMLQDNSWVPDALYFEHSAPGDTNTHRFPVAGQVTYDHYLNGIAFPAQLARYPNRQFDEKLLALLEAQASEQASKLYFQESLLEHIRLLIASSLGFKDVTADSIAKELSMSRRTLNRRLSEYNVSFNNLREDIVFQLAKERLLNSQISITELAQSLGYSDSSAFNRAFKRLSGYRPLEYRKKKGC